MARVLILGGGFGGLAAAHELRRLLAAEHEIVVVDQGDRFFMGFAKLWDLAGVRPLSEGTRALAALERHGIVFRQAAIAGIDPASRSVTTADGEQIAGDALLVALGAADHPQQVAQLGGRAHNVYSADALPAIKADLDAIDGGRVLLAVMGAPFKCPPAPFEAAFLVDERLRRRGVRDAVELVVATPLPATLPVAGPEASRYVTGVLGERGIGLRTEHTAAAVDASRQSVRFAAGDELAYDVLLAVPQNVPPAVIDGSGLAGGSGWIEPDRRTLRTSFERVYAVGDCTVVQTAAKPLPKAGVFAAAEGLVAARNIAADLVGGEPAEFDGRGFCYLELPDRRVALVEGNFFAEPAPDVHLGEATAENFVAKQQFERERLDAWLG